MKRKTYWWFGLVFIVILVIGGYFSFQNHQKSQQVQTIEKVRVNNKVTPTFFFHGWGSSYHAEEKMTTAIKKLGCQILLFV